MQAPIVYRPLRATDYLPVVALWSRCDGIEVAEGDDEASYRAYLDRNPGLSYCAEAYGAIVGAALCGHDGRRGLIYHLAVAPEYRSRGVGKEILNRSLTGLREHGIVRVLILVAGDNTTGREFWAAQGFEEIAGVLPLGMNLRE